jgi:two-component system, cell cycle sensor histidine kinase and response regulator CckA
MIHLSKGSEAERMIPGEQRRLAEEAIRSSEARFHAMFEKHSAVMLLIEPETGRIVDANESAARYYGFEKSELVELGIDALNMLDPSDVASCRHQAFRHERNAFLFPHRLKSGEIRRVEVHSTPIELQDQRLLFSIIHDVTERARFEESLRESEALLAESQSIAHVGSWVFDRLAKRYRWSDETYRIFGYDPARTEPSYEAFLAVVHPDDRERIGRAYDESVFGEASELCVDHRVVQASTGQVRHVQERCRHERDERGRIVRTIGTTQDVTELHRAQAEKERLESQLHQAMKMESVGRLAGGVAHDFNNILTGIIGSVSIARLDLDAESPVHEPLNEIFVAANRAAELTRQLLAFSRKQVIRPRVIGVNDLILKMKKMLRRIIGEDICLETDIVRGIGAIEADPGQIEQVIINLAVNARDAMPRGGHLRIATGRCRLEPREAESLRVEPGDYVSLTVKDTGVGIEEELLKKIFEPFFTTKVEGKGTGLGLAMVYGIVRQHNGGV